MERQKLFNLALKFFLFLSPVFFFRCFQLSFARGMFFVFGSFALWGISLTKEPLRKLSNVWLGLILLWAFVRMFFDNGIEEQEWFNFWLSSAGFIYVFAGVLLFHTVYCHADLKEIYSLPLIIMSVCSLNFFLVICQLLKWDFMWKNAPSLCGFMETSSQLGQYSAMALPLSHPFLIIVPIFTLFASQSVSSYLASFLGISWLLWHLKAKIGLLLLGLVTLVLFIFNYSYIMAKWQCRPIIWQKTLKSALEKPYLGWGYRSWTDKIIQPQEKAYLGGKEYRRPHNDPLHTAHNLGFPLIVFISGFFLNLYRKFKAKKNKVRLDYLLTTSIIIVLVNCCGQTEIRYASIAGTFIVLLALLSIRLDEREVKDVPNTCTN